MTPMPAPLTAESNNLEFMAYGKLSFGKHFNVEHMANLPRETYHSLEADNRTTTKGQQDDSG